MGEWENEAVKVALLSKGSRERAVLSSMPTTWKGKFCYARLSDGSGKFSLHVSKESVFLFMLVCIRTCEIRKVCLNIFCYFFLNTKGVQNTLISYLVLRKGTFKNIYRA